MIDAEIWAQILDICEPFELSTFEAVRRQPSASLDRFLDNGWRWARTPAGDWEAIDWIERLALRAVVHADPDVRRQAYRGGWLDHLVAAVLGAPSQDAEVAALLQSTSGGACLPLWLDPLLGVMDAMVDFVYAPKSFDAGDRARAMHLLLSDQGLPAIVTRLHSNAKLIVVNAVSPSRWANRWCLTVVHFMSQVDDFCHFCNRCVARPAQS